jgi:hypothetical protein
VDKRKKDITNDGREQYFVDEDRMVNEGLGGGYVTTEDNGHIDDSTAELTEIKENEPIKRR